MNQEQTSLHTHGDSSSHFYPTDRDTRRARVLEDSHIERVVHFIADTSNSPLSDELKFLFSTFAGLRACEIASMTLDNVVDADDEISDVIVVGSRSAKGGRERTIPMHPRIRDALTRFRKAYPGVRFLSFSSRWRKGIKRQNASAVKTWFLQLYKNVGLRGCSSHSGRRTFITRMARLANLHGGSLRDVQVLAGHSSLNSTQAYIDPAKDLSGMVAAFSDPPRRAPRRFDGRMPS